MSIESPVSIQTYCICTMYIQYVTMFTNKIFLQFWVSPASNVSPSTGRTEPVRILSTTMSQVTICCFSYLKLWTLTKIENCSFQLYYCGNELTNILKFYKIQVDLKSIRFRYKSSHNHLKSIRFRYMSSHNHLKSINKIQIDV